MNATSDTPFSPAGASGQLERAEQLIWTLLDAEISAENSLELQSLLKEHPHVSKLFIQCVRLHSELLELFENPLELD